MKLKVKHDKEERLTPVFTGRDKGGPGHITKKSYKNLHKPLRDALKNKMK